MEPKSVAELRRDDGCSTYAGSQNKGEKVGAGK
jgi:hypothetical protein